MNTIKARRLRTGILISTAIILFAHLLQYLLPDVATTWNDRIIDRVFQFRTSSATFNPRYDDTVVHVDINQSTLQRIDRRHLNRQHHARVIANLGAMATTSQLYDFVFASDGQKTRIGNSSRLAATPGTPILVWCSSLIGRIFKVAHRPMIPLQSPTWKQPAGMSC